MDLPHVTTWLRQANLSMVNEFGIHSAVFPSAHVSSAFGAAFGMLLAVPDRPRIGWSLLIYAVLVSLATVYGRYHYLVDVLAVSRLDSMRAGRTCGGSRTERSA